jgi:hypothetical protein
VRLRERKKLKVPKLNASAQPRVTIYLADLEALLGKKKLPDEKIIRLKKLIAGCKARFAVKMPSREPRRETNAA